MMEDWDKIANLLGEGFFADKVVNPFETYDLQRVKDYVQNIRVARKTINSNRSICSLEALHKLNRFYEWFLLRYGQNKVKDKKHANAFFERVLDNLLLIPDTRLDFFKWLQKKTLNETSRLMVR